MNIIISTNKKIIDENFLKTSKALVCSGTASLELAKRNIPQLIIYKFNIFIVNLQRVSLLLLLKN